MSRSPKYTTAQLAAAREREIEERRRKREQQRAQQEHEARMRRLAALRDDLGGRLDGLAGRVGALRDSAADTGLGPRRDTLVQEIEQARAAARDSSDEAGVAAADARVAAAEVAVQHLVSQVNGVLAHRRRDQALAAIRASLAAEPDRRDLDATYHGRVDVLVEKTTAAVGDPSAFDGLFPELSRAVDEHLTRARARRLELAEMREKAAAAAAALSGLLDEASSAEANLDGAEAAADTLGRLRAAADSGDVPAARRLTADAGAAADAIDAAFERWLVEQDRTEQIVAAMQQALPAAGLIVDAGTFEFVGSGGRFVARDAGRHPVRIAVVHTDEGSQIVYHADGRDFAVEHTAEGEIATCDLTEDLLERFHQELGKHDVDTGELLWAGKPRARPDARAANELPRSRPGDRQGGR